MPPGQTWFKQGLELRITCFHFYHYLHPIACSCSPMLFSVVIIWFKTFLNNNVTLSRELSALHVCPAPQEHRLKVARCEITNIYHSLYAAPVSTVTPRKDHLILVQHYKQQHFGKISSISQSSVECDIHFISIK